MKHRLFTLSEIQPFPTIPYVLFSPLFLNKGKQQTTKKWVEISWMESNLIQVAPECRDMGGLACPYHGALDQKAYLPRQ
jgi:hypothetical protein